ncbi:MAG: YIP1 family protein [Peptococcaceae bacterium]|nr:MAG: YIP1 family protein [Peptococcaceae bacterium]
MEEKDWTDERVAQAVDAGKDKIDLLELVYGVLFDPTATMKKVALQLPVGLTVLIVTIITLIVTSMGIFTFTRITGGVSPMYGMGHLMTVIQSVIPLIIIFGLLFGYLKWFVFSSVLHLTAEFLGGNGQARGVFIVAGLAGLPSIFIVPFQFLTLLLGSRSIAVPLLMGLAGFGILIWGAVILVIGLAQVHHLSTGRAVLVVLIPAMVIFVLIIVLVAAMISIIFSMANYMSLPGYY